MKHTNRRAVLGIIFIIVGVLFLLDNLQVIDFSIPRYLFTWQAILVVVGIFQLGTGNIKSGAILLTLGVVFWLPVYYDIGFKDYWPVFIILLGISFFLKSRIRQRFSPDIDVVDNLAVLGGTHQSINSKNFSGGKLTSVVGSIELDLRQSSLENGKAVLDVFTTIGSVKLFVPDDWVVNFEATTVFGGFSDKRAHKPTEYFGNVLTIRGLVVFGGAELIS